MIHLWTISRDGVQLDHTAVYEYELNNDYLTDEISEFTMSDNNLIFNHGDFVLGKYSGGEFAIFGVVDSYEDLKLNVKSLLSLVDFEFAATKMSGASFEHHCKTLIDKFLIGDSMKSMSKLVVSINSDTKHIYQPAEPPTPTNLKKYLINGFKKYNVIWRFDRYEGGKIYTVIEKVTDKIQVKDNIDMITDWEVSTVEVGVGVENHLMIVNKTTNNSETPKVLSNWWLNTMGEVTTDKQDPLISKPTKTRVWIYDTTEEDKPTYEDLAKSELRSSGYSHEISFTLHPDNNLLCIEDLYCGLLIRIVRQGKIYESVITGIRRSDIDVGVEIMCGHIRSKLTELLE